MTNPTWEEVAVPRGAYFGWGEQVGQSVTGKVVSYDPSGGTDANGNVCPQLAVELTEAAQSFSRKEGWTPYDAGELVVLNCGMVSLKRAIKAADPNPGDLVKITLESLVKVPKGTVKEVGIKIARTGRPAAAAAAPQFQAPAFGAPQAAPVAAPPF